MKPMDLVFDELRQSSPVFMKFATLTYCLTTCDHFGELCMGISRIRTGTYKGMCHLIIGNRNRMNMTVKSVLHYIERNVWWESFIKVESQRSCCGVSNMYESLQLCKFNLNEGLRMKLGNHFFQHEIRVSEIECVIRCSGVHECHGYSVQTITREKKICLFFDDINSKIEDFEIEEYWHTMIKDGDSCSNKYSKLQKESIQYNSSFLVPGGHVLLDLGGETKEPIYSTKSVSKTKTKILEQLSGNMFQEEHDRENLLSLMVYPFNTHDRWRRDSSRSRNKARIKTEELKKKMKKKEKKDELQRRMKSEVKEMNKLKRMNKTEQKDEMRNNRLWEKVKNKEDTLGVIKTSMTLAEIRLLNNTTWKQFDTICSRVFDVELNKKDQKLLAKNHQKNEWKVHPKSVSTYVICRPLLSMMIEKQEFAADMDKGGTAITNPICVDSVVEDMYIQTIETTEHRLEEHFEPLQCTDKTNTKLRCILMSEISFISASLQRQNYITHPFLKGSTSSDIIDCFDIYISRMIRSRAAILRTFRCSLEHCVKICLSLVQCTTISFSRALTQQSDNICIISSSAIMDEYFIRLNIQGIVTTDLKWVTLIRKRECLPHFVFDTFPEETCLVQYLVLQNIYIPNRILKNLIVIKGITAMGTCKIICDKFEYTKNCVGVIYSMDDATCSLLSAFDILNSLSFSFNFGNESETYNIYIRKSCRFNYNEDVMLFHVQNRIHNILKMSETYSGRNRKLNSYWNNYLHLYNHRPMDPFKKYFRPSAESCMQSCQSVVEGECKTFAYREQVMNMMDEDNCYLYNSVVESIENKDNWTTYYHYSNNRESVPMYLQISNTNEKNSFLLPDILKNTPPKIKEPFEPIMLNFNKTEENKVKKPPTKKPPTKKPPTKKQPTKKPPTKKPPAKKPATLTDSKKKNITFSTENARKYRQIRNRKYQNHFPHEQKLRRHNSMYEKEQRDLDKQFKLVRQLEQHEHDVGTKDYLKSIIKNIHPRTHERPPTIHCTYFARQETKISSKDTIIYKLDNIIDMSTCTLSCSQISLCMFAELIWIIFSYRCLLHNSNVRLGSEYSSVTTLYQKQYCFPVLPTYLSLFIHGEPSSRFCLHSYDLLKNMKPNKALNALNRPIEVQPFIVSREFLRQIERMYEDTNATNRFSVLYDDSYYYPQPNIETSLMNFVKNHRLQYKKYCDALPSCAAIYIGIKSKIQSEEHNILKLHNATEKLSEHGTLLHRLFHNRPRNVSLPFVKKTRELLGIEYRIHFQLLQSAVETSFINTYHMKSDILNMVFTKSHCRSNSDILSLMKFDERINCKPIYLRVDIPFVKSVYTFHLLLHSNNKELRLIGIIVNNDNRVEFIDFCISKCDLDEECRSIFVINYQLCLMMGTFVTDRMLTTDYDEKIHALHCENKKFVNTQYVFGEYLFNALCQKIVISSMFFLRDNCEDYVMRQPEKAPLRKAEADFQRRTHNNTIFMKAGMQNYTNILGSHCDYSEHLNRKPPGPGFTILAFSDRSLKQCRDDCDNMMECTSFAYRTSPKRNEKLLISTICLLLDLRLSDTLVEMDEWTAYIKKNCDAPVVHDQRNIVEHMRASHECEMKLSNSYLCQTLKGNHKYRLHEQNYVSTDQAKKMIKITNKVIHQIENHVYSDMDQSCMLNEKTGVWAPSNKSFMDVRKLRNAGNDLNFKEPNSLEFDDEDGDQTDNDDYYGSHPNRKLKPKVNRSLYDQYYLDDTPDRKKQKSIVQQIRANVAAKISQQRKKRGRMMDKYRIVNNELPTNKMATHLRCSYRVFEGKDADIIGEWRNSLSSNSARKGVPKNILKEQARREKQALKVGRTESLLVPGDSDYRIFASQCFKYCNNFLSCSSFVFYPKNQWVRGNRRLLKYNQSIEYEEASRYGEGRCLLYVRSSNMVTFRNHSTAITFVKHCTEFDKQPNVQATGEYEKVQANKYDNCAPNWLKLVGQKFRYFTFLLRTMHGVTLTMCKDECTCRKDCMAISFKEGKETVNNLLKAKEQNEFSGIDKHSLKYSVCVLLTSNDEKTFRNIDIMNEFGYWTSYLRSGCFNDLPVTLSSFDPEKEREKLLEESVNKMNDRTSHKLSLTESRTSLLHQVNLIDGGHLLRASECHPTWINIHRIKPINDSIILAQGNYNDLDLCQLNCVQAAQCVGIVICSRGYCAGECQLLLSADSIFYDMDQYWTGFFKPWCLLTQSSNALDLHPSIMSNYFTFIRSIHRRYDIDNSHCLRQSHTCKLIEVTNVKSGGPCRCQQLCSWELSCRAAEFTTNGPHFGTCRLLNSRVSAGDMVFSTQSEIYVKVILSQELQRLNLENQMLKSSLENDILVFVNKNNMASEAGTKSGKETIIEDMTDCLNLQLFKTNLEINLRKFDQIHFGKKGDKSKGNKGKFNSKKLESTDSESKNIESKHSDSKDSQSKDSPSKDSEDSKSNNGKSQDRKMKRKAIPFHHIYPKYKFGYRPYDNQHKGMTNCIDQYKMLNRRKYSDNIMPIVQLATRNILQCKRQCRKMKDCFAINYSQLPISWTDRRKLCQIFDERSPGHLVESPFHSTYIRLRRCKRTINETSEYTSGCHHNYRVHLQKSIEGAAIFLDIKDNITRLACVNLCDQLNLCRGFTFVYIKGNISTCRLFERIPVFSLVQRQFHRTFLKGLCITDQYSSHERYKKEVDPIQLSTNIPIPIQKKCLPIFYLHRCYEPFLETPLKTISLLETNTDCQQLCLESVICTAYQIDVTSFDLGTISLINIISKINRTDYDPIPPQRHEYSEESQNLTCKLYGDDIMRKSEDDVCLAKELDFSKIVYVRKCMYENGSEVTTGDTDEWSHSCTSYMKELGKYFSRKYVITNILKKYSKIYSFRLSTSRNINEMVCVSLCEKNRNCFIMKYSWRLRHCYLVERVFHRRIPSTLSSLSSLANALTLPSFNNQPEHVIYLKFNHLSFKPVNDYVCNSYKEIIGKHHVFDADLNMVALDHGLMFFAELTVNFEECRHACTVVPNCAGIIYGSTDHGGRNSLCLPFMTYVSSFTKEPIKYSIVKNFRIMNFLHKIKDCKNSWNCHMTHSSSMMYFSMADNCSEVLESFLDDQETIAIIDNYSNMLSLEKCQDICVKRSLICKAIWFFKDDGTKGNRCVLLNYRYQSFFTQLRNSNCYCKNSVGTHKRRSVVVLQNIRCSHDIIEDKQFFHNLFTDKCRYYNKVSIDSFFRKFSLIELKFRLFDVDSEACNRVCQMYDECYGYIMSASECNIYQELTSTYQLQLPHGILKLQTEVNFHNFNLPNKTDNNKSINDTEMNEKITGNTDDNNISTNNTKSEKESDKRRKEKEDNNDDLTNVNRKNYQESNEDDKIDETNLKENKNNEKINETNQKKKDDVFLVGYVKSNRC
ncbi:hypothetical protein SNEBB_010350 [Seison nebaliae]|nr:hypothetical protein SNEBB_010350 [Seison nebaliae]